MSFLHPAFFWVLLAIGPLVAIYLLKVRPRQRPVRALFLWQAVMDQKKNTALFHRLRDLWSLLLMLLTLIAIVLAMAEPELTADQRQDLLLIIDNSASMNALEKGQTRLTQACDLAQGFVRAMNGSQQTAVATLAWDMQYQTHFTNSPKLLLDAIQHIEASDCPLRPQALSSLQAGVEAMENCRILLLSDGCRFQPDPNSHIEFVKIGSDQGNLGFVNGDLRWLPTMPPRIGLYYQLASSYPEPIATDIIIAQGPDQRMAKVLPITVQPGINPAEVTTLPSDASGQWTVTLDHADALACDNTAYLALPARQPMQIGIASEHPFFLWHSIQAFAQTSGHLVYVTDQADVVLTQGQIPQAQRSILLGLTEQSGWWGQVGAEVDNVLARIKIEDHPLLRDCDIDSVPFIGARQVTCPDNSLVIVETSDHVPLIYQVQHEGQSALVINMDMVDSEFYYSAWFPILVYNSARSLMGRQHEQAAACPLGESIPVPPDTVATHLGSQTSLPMAQNLCGPVRQTGFVNFEHHTDQWLLGANLFAPAETLLNNREVIDTHRPLSLGRRPALALTLAGAGLLLLESLLYHRRKVG